MPKIDYIFFAGHPAQYYMLKNSYNYFKKMGKQVRFVIRDKDILEKLLIEDNQQYYKINTKGKRKGKWLVLLLGFFDIIVQDIRLFKFCLFNRPKLMIGTDYSIAHVGFVLGIPSFVLNEDDFSINKYFCKLAYPFATKIISPNVCDVGKYAHKKIGYNGYQKLAYLHPNYFSPDINVRNKYFPADEKYVLIRVVNFNAGHDIESVNSGISEELIKEIIAIIQAYGYTVYISGETELSEDLKKYALKIRATDIHHVMCYSGLFIADSQSMIVEASILGVPSIRFNSFVGKISVMNELETVYQLTNGIPVKEPEVLKAKIREILSDLNYRNDLLVRRDKMLSEKTDLTELLIKLMSDYNSSTSQIN